MVQQNPQIWNKLTKSWRKLTENILCQPEPLVWLNCFLQSSHLALIDTLMMAYTVEMMSVERVMSCIGRYTSAEPSRSEEHLQELPYDTEDAIVTWINKVRKGGLLCTYWNTHACKHPRAVNREHTQLCFRLGRWWVVYRLRDLTCLLIN